MEETVGGHTTLFLAESGCLLFSRLVSVGLSPVFVHVPGSAHPVQPILSPLLWCRSLYQGMCFAAVCRYVGLGTLSKKIGCAIYLQAVVFQESECGEYSHLPELEQGWLHKGQFMQVSPLLCHLPWQPPSLPVLPRGSSFVSL